MWTPIVREEPRNRVEVVNCCSDGTPVLLDGRTGDDLLRGSLEYTSNQSIQASAFITSDTCASSGAHCSKVEIRMNLENGTSAVLDIFEGGSFAPIGFQFSSGCSSLGHVECPRQGCDLRPGWDKSDLKLTCKPQSTAQTVDLQVIFCQNDCSISEGLHAYGSSGPGKTFDVMASFAIVASGMAAAIIIILVLRTLCIPKRPARPSSA